MPRPSPSCPVAIALPLALLLAVIGCHREAAPRPTRIAPDTRAAASARPGKWCPGGLLCEDATTLGAYRVPVACGGRKASSRLARCTLRHVPWEAVVEFYRSRYRDLRATGRDLLVTGLAGLNGPRPATPIDQPCGERPPILRAFRYDRAAEIVVVGGSWRSAAGGAPKVMPSFGRASPNTDW